MLIPRLILRPSQIVLTGVAFATLAVLAVGASAGPVIQNGSASISGKVTVDGKGGPGIVVVLTATISDPNRAMDAMFNGVSSAKVVTDSEGTYRFDGVTAGQYYVNAFAPAYVQEAGKTNGLLVVADGDHIEGLDVALKRGGVITGTVLRPDGRPAIGVQIQREQITETGAAPAFESGAVNQISIGPADMVLTDDRGVYRMYGLPSGKFRVKTAGTQLRPGLAIVENLEQSFYYPGVVDPSAAASVQVKAGAETTGIDIKLGAPPPSYEADGKLTDDAGNPVPNVLINPEVVAPTESNLDTSPGYPVEGSGAYTNSAGQFKLKGLRSGKYRATPSLGVDNERQLYGDAVDFEIKDASVSGLELKAHKGSTLSGIVVVEGTDDPQVIETLSQQNVFCAEAPGSSGGATTHVGADGSFMFKGLAPGEVIVGLGSTFGLTPFRTARVELNGAPVKRGIDIQEGQPVSGVRIVVVYANCAITGDVAITAGKLSPGEGLSVTAIRKQGELNDSTGQGPAGLFGNDMFSSDGSEVDQQGHFRIEELIPGDYEIVVHVVGRTGSSNLPGSSQVVTVTSGSEATVSLSIDLSSTAGKSNQ
ncbi:MAG TPA: carboxypeptidase-like regulatory domain-containing protein [Blastocatellia bacterium]|nr:carboxypeptidase-like regulatory domain-containing protein [Blastocatellia bacterium]